MDDLDRNDFDDLTQEQLHQLMQTDLDFTSTESDANRKYHRKFFLSEDIVYSSVYGFEAGATYCKTTGELIEPKFTREIKGMNNREGTWERSNLLTRFEAAASPIPGDLRRHRESRRTRAEELLTLKVRKLVKLRSVFCSTNTS